MCTDPPGERGAAVLLQLQVGGQVGPDDERRVEALPQLRTALEEEVDDEELYTCVHTWAERDKSETLNL